MAKRLIEVGIFLAGTLAGIAGKTYVPQMFNGKKKKSSKKKEEK